VNKRFEIRIDWLGEKPVTYNRWTEFTDSDHSSHFSANWSSVSVYFSLILGRQTLVRPGRPRGNRTDTIRQRLKEIGVFLEEAQKDCSNREDWHQYVAQCVFNMVEARTKDQF